MTVPANYGTEYSTTSTTTAARSKMKKLPLRHSVCFIDNYR